MRAITMITVSSLALAGAAMAGSAYAAVAGHALWLGPTASAAPVQAAESLEEGGFILAAAKSLEAGEQGLAQPPRIEVVFVLDTTGSMSGLIEGAKQKIWSIATDMLNTDTPADIRFGLIGFRDVGDDYVVRRYALTDDIHDIYGKLLEFNASGGGDRPESVNQALYEGVTQMGWDDDPSALRLVFLVGDSPPHMDYEQDVKYYDTAAMASDRDIVINTVLVGGHADTRAIWREIARLGGGNFAEIPQSGGMQRVVTPYDDRIQELQLQINATVIPYGAASERDRTFEKAERSSAADESVGASIAGYRMAKGKVNQVVTGGGDLVEDFEDGKVDLSELPEAELSDELRAMSPEERAELIAEKVSERAAINKEIADLVEERDAWIRDQAEADAPKDSFDAEVAAAVRAQAAAKGIVYKD